MAMVQIRRVRRFMRSAAGAGCAGRRECSGGRRWSSPVVLLRRRAHKSRYQLARGRAAHDRPSWGRIPTRGRWWMVGGARVVQTRGRGASRRSETRKNGRTERRDETTETRRRTQGQANRNRNEHRAAFCFFFRVSVLPSLGAARSAATSCFGRQTRRTRTTRDRTSSSSSSHA